MFNCCFFYIIIIMLPTSFSVHCATLCYMPSTGNRSITQGRLKSDMGVPIYYTSPLKFLWSGLFLENWIKEKSPFPFSKWLKTFQEKEKLVFTIEAVWGRQHTITETAYWDSHVWKYTQVVPMSLVLIKCHHTICPLYSLSWFHRPW